MVGTGREPVSLGDEVRGTLELSDFYAADRLERVRAQVTPVTVGTRAEVLVPVGEIWRVRGLECALVFANIGDQAAVSVGLKPDPINLIALAHQTIVPASVSANGQAKATLWMGAGLILKAGFGCYARCDEIVVGANPMTLNVHALIERIPA